MRMLNMNDLSDVKRTHLAGKTRIGQGGFAEVFADPATPDRVSKLTVDPFNYYLLADALWHEIRQDVEHCFPRLLEDHGDVGESGGRSVYLVEVERLYPVTAPEHKRQISAWAKQYGHSARNSPDHRRHRNADVLNWESVEFCAQQAENSDNPYQAVFEALHNFLSNYGGALDLKHSNFMCRANGELVWNDVVFDAKAYDLH